MKVITKRLTIYDDDFVLIRDEQKGLKFYGTIPYSELDENGKMKRELNGFQMCIADTIPEAMLKRQNEIKYERYMKLGHSKAEGLLYIANGYKERIWDKSELEMVQAICK